MHSCRLKRNPADVCESTANVHFPFQMRHTPLCATATTAISHQQGISLCAACVASGQPADQLRTRVSLRISSQAAAGDLLSCVAVWPRLAGDLCALAISRFVGLLVYASVCPSACQLQFSSVVVLCVAVRIVCSCIDLWRLLGKFRATLRLTVGVYSLLTAISWEVWTALTRPDLNYAHRLLRCYCEGSASKCFA